MKYAWAAGDTASWGSFKGEFVVTYSDAAKETFPNRFYIDVLISKSL